MGKAYFHELRQSHALQEKLLDGINWDRLLEWHQLTGELLPGAKTAAELRYFCQNELLKPVMQGRVSGSIHSGGMSVARLRCNDGVEYVEIIVGAAQFTASTYMHD